MLAGLWKSPTGCHTGEIQRPERWRQMHREDEWKMVGQQMQICSPLTLTKCWNGFSWLSPPVCFPHKPLIYHLLIDFSLKYLRKLCHLTKSLIVLLGVVHVYLSQRRILLYKWMTNNWHLFSQIDLFWILILSFSCVAGLVGDKSMQVKMMVPLTILLSVIMMRRCQDLIDLERS